MKRKTFDLQKTSEDVMFKSAFEQFVRTKTNRSMSPDTIIHYKNMIKQFTKFFDEENYCADITPDTIEDYIAYLRKRNPSLAGRTYNTYLSALRTVLYFAMQREYMPKFKISLISHEKKVKETYTKAELELLLKKPDIKKCGFPTYRN